MTIQMRTFLFSRRSLWQRVSQLNFVLKNGVCNGGSRKDEKRYLLVKTGQERITLSLGCINSSPLTSTLFHFSIFQFHFNSPVHLRM